MFDFFRPVPKKRTVKLRNKSGVLFHNPSLLGKTLFHFGNVLIVVALGYAYYLYYPLAGAVIAYWQIPKTPPPMPIVRPTPSPIPSGFIPTPTAVIAQSTEYTITIPKIGAYADIVQNVSAFSQKEYSNVLKDKVVAQAKGSYLAGSGAGKSTFIFAHSTEQGIQMVRQNSVFYLLGELRDGDSIIVNVFGKELNYKVYSKKIVNASEVEYLKYSDPDRDVLILQTCWPLGTDWKRLLVFAEKM